MADGSIAIYSDTQYWRGNLLYWHFYSQQFSHYIVLICLQHVVIPYNQICLSIKALVAG